MSVPRIATMAALAVAVAAANAGAQAKCEIEEGKPKQVKEARDALVKGGFDPVSGVGGEAAQRYISEEIIRLTPVIKATRFMQK